MAAAAPQGPGRRAGWKGLAFSAPRWAIALTFGACGFGIGMLVLPPIASAPAQQSSLASRVASLEARFAQFNGQQPAPSAARITALEEQVERLTARLQAMQVPQAARMDRFLVAALNLQATLGTNRPFTRELQLLRDTAPEGAVPSVLADALISHAHRGLATMSDLRDGFDRLAPTLVARAPNPESWGSWAFSQVKRLFAWLGLIDKPEPSAAETTVANVARLLAQGQVTAAMADLETLDISVHHLFAGWMAQARARLAAEQALQELILKTISQSPAR